MEQITNATIEKTLETLTDCLYLLYNVSTEFEIELENIISAVATELTRHLLGEKRLSNAKLVEFKQFTANLQRSLMVEYENKHI